MDAKRSKLYASFFLISLERRKNFAAENPREKKHLKNLRSCKNQWGRWEKNWKVSERRYVVRNE